MIYQESQQSVFPKVVYIGDNAQMICSFKTDYFLAAQKLSTGGFLNDTDFSQYQINNIEIEPSGTDFYNLKIDFIPWRTGFFQFPDFEIENVGIIHFEPVKISSLVEQENISELEDSAAPLILPGTVYKVYGSIIAILIFIIISIRIVIKRKKIIFWLKNKKLRRKYLKNKRITIKKLKQLIFKEKQLLDNFEKDGLGQRNIRSQVSSQISTELQKIMRLYLEERLEYPFTKVLTSEMSMAFQNATFNLADENRESAFEDIIQIFVRTDYLRFSSSIFSVFNEGELIQTINKLIDDISVIEEC